MYSEELEMLIDAALADGQLTEKEKQVLFRRAQSEGIDLDEFEMILDARLLKQKKAQQANAAAAAPMPQSNKFGGEVKKCPACGATYVAGTAVCPECGYAFYGMAPTRSAVMLYEKLQAFNEANNYTNNDDSQKFRGIGSVYANLFAESFNKGKKTMEQDIARRKFDVIQSFPVPNSREDLIDFLTAIQPKADPNAPKTGVDKSFTLLTASGREYNENLGYAYWLLYSNCINKAKISFANDPDFAPFFAFYESKAQPILKKKGLFGRG